VLDIRLSLKKQGKTEKQELSYSEKVVFAIPGLASDACGNGIGTFGHPVAHVPYIILATGKKMPGVMNYLFVA
jgi:hypothetical protein